MLGRVSAALSSVLTSKLIGNEDIALKGWGTAIYPPPDIDRLHEAYEKIADDMLRLDRAARNVSGFELKGQDDSPETYDDATDESTYRNEEIAYFFPCGRGEFAVLFSKRGADGRCERLTAVFVRGAVGDDVREWLLLLVKNFADAIESELRTT